MGLFDRLTGTSGPRAGAASLSAATVRTALLAINGPGVPYAVREGTPGERADLVAEWHVRGLDLRLRTRMRLVPARREVRAVDEQWDGVTREYGRGPTTTVSRQWTYERGPDGRRRRVETLRVDPREMRNPLRAAVIGAGWTWRGVLFRL